ncbi:adenylyl-sulfate kinase [Mucilaginibacter sp. UYCu711]|uniref:adenylyl-sulfate kinase n=1 Tax=Mucilaginibacter sp. UYCu711 TaxID=3156339 RepID=UPI003D258068
MHLAGALFKYLTTPIEVCIERDTKGFYEKIKQELLKNFTGIDSVFELQHQQACI